MTNLIPEIKVTTDDLAIMIAKGFRGVDEKMSGLEKRLTGKIDSVDTRLTSLESKVNQMDMRLTSQLDNVVLNYTRRDEHSKLEKRVRRLELVPA
jgi:hypothetical protein